MGMTKRIDPAHRVVLGRLNEESGGLIIRAMNHELGEGFDASFEGIQNGTSWVGGEQLQHGKLQVQGARFSSCL